ILRAPEVRQLGLGALLSQAFSVGASGLLASFVMAAGTALLCWLVALLMAGAGLRRALGTPMLAGLLLLAALPGPILGIGLVLLWNRPGEPWLSLYDSPLMLVLAGAGRFLPLGALLTCALLSRHDPEHDEAARLAG